MDIREIIAFDAAASKVRKTKEGFLVALPRIARTGIQDYALMELADEEYANKVLGITDYNPRARVRVYRPESVVLATDTMASFTNMPCTVNHPPVMVDADNWKEYSVGDTGEEAIEDKQTADDKKQGRKYVRVPMMLRDSNAIDLVMKKGIKELSVGYGMKLDWTPGKDSVGNEYDASVKKIVGNHLAIVPNARGGDTLKIGDATEDSTMDTVIMTVDGISISVTAKDKQILDKHIDALQESLKTSNDALKTAQTLVLTKDGEIAALTKQVVDAKVTPEKLSAMVKDRAEVEEIATDVLGEERGVKGWSTTEEMKREVVTKYTGDAAKGYDDVQVSLVFDGIKATMEKDEGYAKRKKAKTDGKGATRTRDASMQARREHLTDNVHPLLGRGTDMPNIAATHKTKGVGDDNSVESRFDRLLAATDSRY